jgi:iron complex outermembrane recepter protein
MKFKHTALCAALSLALSDFAVADDTYRLPDVIVTAPNYYLLLNAADVDAANLPSMRPATSDTASLLRDIAGVNLYSAGGVSSLPTIHGMADDRLRIQVDGMDLIAACPNHMNSPLSYIDPTNVGSARVFAGITPVSVGGDSIGGTIQVDSLAPEFAQPGQGTLRKGEAGTYYRSNGNAKGANLSATLANENVSISYNGSTAEADDYSAGGNFKAAGLAATGKGWLDGDTVGSTAYKSENQSLNFAMRRDSKLFEFKVGFQHIPYEAFPNQRMDMTGNDSTQLNFHFKEKYQWGALDARVYHEATEHEMNFGDDKQYQYGTAPGMPMNTQGKNTGAVVKADIALSARDTLKIGSEYQQYRLDDWWPASGTGGMSPNTFWNINNGQRDRFDVFGEWEARWNTQWLSQMGIRSDIVTMDTGAVQGYNSSYATDANAFNASDRSRMDHNIDLTALTRYTPGATQTYEFGYAQKTRSPNLYERYVWSTNAMAAIMNNFAGDGNGYVGNPYLKPEVAHTFSATADWHDTAKEQWGLKLTPYYTYVENYIDAECRPGTTCTVDKFNVLQYVNQSAQLYGIDLSGHTLLGSSRDYGNFIATATANYTRGENLTTGDNLYNIMPLNMKLALVQHMGKWRNTVETQFVAAKTDVSQVRNEVKTGGYSLVNLRSSYEWKRVRLDIGIDNLFDKSYALPLGGTYVGQGKTMSINGVPWGIAVPGMGRSLYTGVSFTF